MKKTTKTKRKTVDALIKTSNNVMLVTVSLAYRIRES